MTTAVFTAHRIRELFLNGLWIANTNYKTLLESISFDQAVQKIGSINSIAALTYHINYYLKGVLSTLQGGPLDIHDKFSFNLPSIHTEKDWQVMVHKLLTNAEKFAAVVETLTDEKLQEPFVNKKYGSNLRNIEAIIEHSYYHLGQISLIKKMIVQI